MCANIVLMLVVVWDFFFRMLSHKIHSTHPPKNVHRPTNVTNCEFYCCLGGDLLEISSA